MKRTYVLLVLSAIPISLTAMFKSLNKHHNYKCFILAGLGLFLLFIAIFMRDTDIGLEQLHDYHGIEDHAHDKLGGLGETLETIFSILGGLVLLGAHFLKIKLSKKPN